MKRAALSRRDLLRGTALAALGMTAGGCASPFVQGVSGAGAGRSQLAYWNLFSGGDGVRMDAMESYYQKTHKSTDLSAVTLAWGNPYYTKLALATLGDRPPDVAISHLTRMRTLADAGLLEPFDEDVLASFGMTADKFTSKAWEGAHVNGKLYAIPLDTHPFVLYYNTDVCKKAGLLKPDGTLKDMRGPDEFVEFLTAAKKVTGEWGCVTDIIDDPATCWRWFSTLYWQLGGQVLADNGAKVVLDDTKAIKVLQFQQELTVKRKLMPAAINGQGVTALFSTGKAGFLLDGEWDVTTYQAAKTPFNMTAIPNIFGGPYVCQADSHTFVLPRSDKRDADRLQLDLEFIRTLLGQSYTWAEGGHIPAWLPVQNSATYHALKPQSNYIDAAYAAHYDDPAWYSGSGSDFETVVGDAVSGVEAGLQSPEQGYQEMLSGLTTYAKTPPPVA
jgi:multiple sugar transport system substrate-binding protein